MLSPITRTCSEPTVDITIASFLRVGVPDMPGRPSTPAALPVVNGKHCLPHNHVG